MTGTSDHFSRQAEAYAQYRPRYPGALFDFLASVSPGTNRAWDSATGNGQAAAALRAHFRTVIATDASLRQVALAPRLDRVGYAAARSEASPIASRSIDLITVATALHWLDHEAFYHEVRRVGRPGAVLAAWCYQIVSLAPPLGDLIRHFARTTVGPHWPPGRHYVDEGYRTLPFPFERIEAPRFVIRVRWNLDRLVGYVGTWSAVARARDVTGRDPLAQLVPALTVAWGPGAGEEVRDLEWDLHLLVGRVDA